MPELILYIKAWCPWCISAKEVLDRLGLPYKELDVNRSPEAYSDMIQISGQRLTPTLLLKTDQTRHVLSDFGPEELEPFLKKHRILN